MRGGGRGGGGACGGGTGKRIAERDHRYVRLFPRWKKGRWAVMSGAPDSDWCAWHGYFWLWLAFTSKISSGEIGTLGRLADRSFQINQAILEITIHCHHLGDDSMSFQRSKKSYYSNDTWGVYDHPIPRCEI